MRTHNLDCPRIGSRSGLNKSCNYYRTVEQIIFPELPLQAEFYILTLYRNE